MPAAFQALSHSVCDAALRWLLSDGWRHWGNGCLTTLNQLGISQNLPPQELVCLSPHPPCPCSRIRGMDVTGCNNDPFDLGPDPASLVPAFSHWSLFLSLPTSTATHEAEKSRRRHQGPAPAVACPVLQIRFVHVARGVPAQPRHPCGLCQGYLSSFFPCFLLFLPLVLSVFLEVSVSMYVNNLWLWATTKAKLRFCLLLWPETLPAASPALPTALFGLSVGRSAEKKGRKEHFLSVLCESIYILFPSSTQGTPGSWFSLPALSC